MNNITVKNVFDKFKNFKESYCDASTCKYYEQNLCFFFDFLEQEYKKSLIAFLWIAWLLMSYKIISNILDLSQNLRITHLRPEKQRKEI
jgi:hypothetical protein